MTDVDPPVGVSAEPVAAIAPVPALEPSPEAAVGPAVAVIAPVELNLVAGLAVAVLAGAALVAGARAGALPLLVAVAAVQAVFALAWVLGTAMPGRWGGLVIGALASGAADTMVSVWPHGRLGTLLPVLGLAIPAMFVHQLTRGAARVQVTSSLSAVALLVLAEVSLPALLQLRHEFVGADAGGKVVAAAVAACAGGLVVGYLVDMIIAVPRFDQDVPRGLLGLLAAAALGAAVGQLLLRDDSAFAGGRAAFVGAALGALSGLVAIAAAFVLFTTPEPASAFGRRLRPVLAALLPLCLVAPAAFLLCLAIRI